MKTLLTFLAAVMVTTASLCAEPTVLWPSDKTVLRAQPDSRIALLSDGAMGVETGVKYRWPGIRGRDDRCEQYD